MNQFERLQQFAKLQKPPQIKFKDLEAAVTSTIKYNLLPMRCARRLHGVTPLEHHDERHAAVRPKELQFQDKEGVSKATVNIYARITSMSRRPVNIFEDMVASKFPRLCSWAKR